MKLKKTSLALFLIFIIGATHQSEAVSPPITGEKCMGQNFVQVYKGKKYTCIKSGKKLVWNKGVTVANKKPISNPTPVPSPQTSSGISWNNFGFDDPNRCKLKAVNRDLSDDGPDDLGFPNPSSLLGKSNIRAVGIFVDFPDSTGDSSTVESSKRIAENISSFYSQISYGKVKITWAFTSNFYTLPHKSSYYNFTPEKWLKYGDDQTHYLQDAVDVSDTDIDFSNFDLVLLFPAKTAAPNMPSYAYPGTHSAYFWKIVSKEGLIRNMQSVMASDYQNSDQFVAGRYSNTSWFNIVHEIGHEFMLPDLYQSGLSQEEHSRNVGVYDIMGAYSNSGAGIELNGWSRWALGFLEDKQVICLTKTGTYQIKLSAIEKADDSQKIAVIPISDSKALLIETRRAIGLDAGLNEKSTGVLTYMLDTSVGTGKGPLKLLLPARSKDTRYLSDVALKVGDTINFLGFEIQVLSSGPDDDVIKIKNTNSLTDTPTPSPSPSPIPTPTPQLIVKVFESYTNNGLPYPGTTVTDHLSIVSNFDVAKVLPIAIAADGATVWTGSAELISGTKSSGKWRIIFTVPKFLDPGKYTKKYLVGTESGLEISALDWVIEVQRPKYWIKQTCALKNSDCPKTLSETQLKNISTCKIADATKDIYYGSMKDFSRNGFPRPTRIWKNGVNPRILFVPIEYSDLKFDQALEQDMAVEYQLATKFYLDSSYGKLSVSFETAPRASWISIPETWKDWSKKNSDDLIQITKSSIDLVQGIDLTKYDSVFFGTSKSFNLYWGGGTQEVYQSAYGPIENVYFTVGGDKKSFEHNLGHTLFQLEDLYIHSWNTEAVKVRSSSVIQFDIMANGSSPDFIGWNRWLNGWLTDSDISCLDPNVKTQTLRIGYLGNAEGKRLLVIPGSYGIGYFVEYRDALFNEGRGLFVYHLDSNTQHGSGPLEGVNTLLSSGESVEFRGYRFSVLGADTDGAYVRIEKLDG